MDGCEEQPQFQEDARAEGDGESRWVLLDVLTTGYRKRDEAGGNGRRDKNENDDADCFADIEDGPWDGVG